MVDRELCKPVCKLILKIMYILWFYLCTVVCKWQVISCVGWQVQKGCHQLVIILTICPSDGDVKSGFPTYFAYNFWFREDTYLTTYDLFRAWTHSIHVYHLFTCTPATVYLVPTEQVPTQVWQPLYTNNELSHHQLLPLFQSDILWLIYIVQSRSFKRERRCWSA
jgi:hypothetical protein